MAPRPPISRPPRSAVPSCGVALCALALVACAGGVAGEIAGQPGLLTALKGHYDAHALEENGLCGSPELGLVTSSSIEQLSADRLAVRVSYVYRDPTAKLADECRGFGTRSFRVARSAGGFEVLEMAGPRREGIQINRIDGSSVW